MIIIIIIVLKGGQDEDVVHDDDDERWEEEWIKPFGQRGNSLCVCLLRVRRKVFCSVSFRT